MSIDYDELKRRREAADEAVQKAIAERQRVYDEIHAELDREIAECNRIIRACRGPCRHGKARQGKGKP